MNTERQHPLDRSAWGPGPWDGEPDRHEWRHAGLPCLLVRSYTSGSWCGYVGIPPGHPAHGRAYSDVEVEVHGGLTYGAPCRTNGRICHVPRPGEPADVFWLGFGCAHAFDASPGMRAREKELLRELALPELASFEETMSGFHQGYLEHYWTLPEVVAETEQLEHYWTLPEVVAETEQLADQLARMTA